MALEKQISIFVQNKVGSLGKICSAFSKSKIDVKALSIFDDLEWGIVRVVVDQPEKAAEVLHHLKLMYGESQVVTTEVANHPGALASLAEKLSKKKININQAFATAKGDKSLVVLSTTDDKKANNILSGISK